MYILNKTFGSWSAGTHVNIVNRKGSSATVEHTSTHERFEIPIHYLTQRRSRVRT